MFRQSLMGNMKFFEFKISCLSSCGMAALVEMLCKWILREYKQMELKGGGSAISRDYATMDVAIYMDLVINDADGQEGKNGHK